MRVPHLHLSLTAIVITLVSGVSVADEKAGPKPAAVAEAVKVLDFATFPLLAGVKEPGTRNAARLSYNAPSNCKTAFEFQRKTLLGLKWTEVPGSNVTDEYASGMFTRDGFVASVSTMPLSDPKQPGFVNVSIMQHGNVDLKKLPLPSGCKSLYVGPQVAMYTTEAPVAKTVEACHKLLEAQGWLPYGKVEGTHWFKQNAVRLTTSVSAAPGQEGKTTISFSAEQLSADLPAPTETVQLQYSDSTKQLLFDTKESEDDIVAFYRKALNAAGWKATTDKTFKVDWKSALVFRNAAKEMLNLELYTVKDEGVLRVTLKHQSAAEVAAEEQRFAAAVAAKKKQMEQEKNPLFPKVTVTLPKDAAMNEITKKQLEFTIATGKSKATAAAIRKQFKDDGWKEEVLTADDMIGEIAFKKDKQEISLSYINTGIMPAEFTLKGTQVELERATSKE